MFLLFVQGGQSLLYTIGKNKEERDLLVNTLGHKWEFTFTTLVVFGGAFFASFPLFYSTSFGGAYVVWMLILFCFVIQAVSYEYRSKRRNFLGTRTYETFLMINGFAAPFLLGAAVATFFTGSPFRIGEMNQVEWMTPWRGLDALGVWTNYLLGFAVLFLARTQAALYFILTIDNEAVRTRSRKQVLWNAIPFVVFFLWFLAAIFTGEGYAISDDGSIVLEKYKYFRNLVEMPLNAILFLLGVAGVLYFYPSSTDIQSSLTIYNASSSLYTLKAMSWVSLAIPFVAAYIWYAWRALTRKPMDAKELEEAENKY